MSASEVHPFADPALLDVATTHASWAHEHGGPDNERLEFLGDAVLQLCATRALFTRFPDAGEGELSRMRQRLVNTRALAEVARGLGLGGSLKLGVGEEQTGGRDRDRVLAGAAEALLGAVFLDAGFAVADALVGRWTERAVARLIEEPTDTKDARSQLQERTQRDSGATPTYALVATEGPAHAPTFAMEVRLGETVLGRGRGPSKREAAQRAAEEALSAPRQDGK